MAQMLSIQDWTNTKTLKAQDHDSLLPLAALIIQTIAMLMTTQNSFTEVFTDNSRTLFICAAIKAKMQSETYRWMEIMMQNASNLCGAGAFTRWAH